MQLSIVWSPVFRVMCVLVVLVGVSACGKGSAAGDGAPAASAGDARSGYVLRTQMRPEVPAKYFAIERAFHQACVALAKGLNLPAKPFFDVPADFVAERRTYASDGKRFSYSELSYIADTEKMKHESGCEVRLTSQWRTYVVSDGQERVAVQDEGGAVEVSDAQPVLDYPVPASRLTSRTLSRRIAGVPLKCDADDTCIVDPDVVVIAQNGRPVQVAYRNDDVRTYGTVLLYEPVSLSVGAPADPDLFSLKARK